MIPVGDGEEVFEGECDRDRFGRGGTFDQLEARFGGCSRTFVRVEETFC